MAPNWWDPGAFEVAPGVHRVPLPLPNDGLRAVNVYIVTTPDGPVLIDSGWALPAAEELLAAALGELGYGLPDITRFLVTHVHRDHYWQAVELRRRFGGKVELGAGERPTLEILWRAGDSRLTVHADRLEALGATELAAILREQAADRVVNPRDWEPPDVWLEPGEIPLPGGRVLEAVSTPGHTAGHLVFHDLDAALLFAGDHVLPTITPSIGFEAAAQRSPLEAFLSSLAAVRARPDATLLPAHGPVTDSVHRRVDELISHHGHRLDEIERAVKLGITTPAEVAAAIRWTRRGRTHDELDAQNQMLAIFETAAHLEVLVAQNRVNRIGPHSYAG